MTTVLEQASREWSSRPADQRFSSLEALHTAVTERRVHSYERPEIPVATLRAEAADGKVVLTGAKNVPSKLSHWAFGQLSSLVGAPAGYLRNLPATLAVQNLNHGLKKLDVADPEATTKILLYQNGEPEVRALTSEDYARIWDSDVISRLIRLTEENPVWQPAPAAFDGSRGLYASDHDVFAFLVDNERRIFEKDQNGGLGRGFFVKNSETGASSFQVTTFFYEYVCGNHRVWGASGVRELRIRHVGRADDRAFSLLAGELRTYAESTAADDETKIASAKTFILGGNKDEVLDKVFGLRIPGLGRKLIEAGYDKAVEHEAWYGNPRSAWGLTGGLTEVARDMEYADKRTEIDRAAGKVLQLAF